MVTAHATEVLSKLLTQRQLANLMGVEQVGTSSPQFVTANSGTRTKHEQTQPHICATSLQARRSTMVT